MRHATPLFSPLSFPSVLVGSLTIGMVLAVGTACASKSPEHPVTTGPATPEPPEPPESGPLTMTNTPGGDLTFHHDGFPAISTDGSLVAVPWTGSDGNRGNPNLHLLIHDIASGQDTLAMTIVSADEVHHLDGDEPALLDLVAARLARANQALSGRAWIPLTGATATGPTADDGAPPPLDIAGVTVTFNEPRLTVRAGDQTLLDQPHPEWSVAPTEGPPTTARGDMLRCEHEAYLYRAWVDDKRRALVIAIGYTGSDMCPEPTERVRALALARSPGR